MYEFTLNESQTGYLKYYSFCLISSSSKIKIFYISFAKGLIKLIMTVRKKHFVCNVYIWLYISLW